MLGYLPRQTCTSAWPGAHCLLVTSVREGWGMVITEAYSVGTPAVGYDVGGIKDSIRDGRTGLLATAGDPMALATQAISLVTDDARYGGDAVGGDGLGRSVLVGEDGRWAHGARSRRDPGGSRSRGQKACAQNPLAPRP